MLKMREHGPEQGGRYETGWILTKFEKESELQSLTRQCVNQTFYRWKLCEKYQRHGISVFSLFWMEAVHRSNGSSLTCNIFFFRFFLYPRWRDFRRIQTLIEANIRSVLWRIPLSMLAYQVVFHMAEERRWLYWRLRWLLGSGSQLDFLGDFLAMS